MFKTGVCMVGEDLFVFPVEYQLIPVQEMASGLIPVEAMAGDVLAVTRGKECFPVRVVDFDEAALLSEFRSPISMVEALMNCSKQHPEHHDRFVNRGIAFLRTIERVGVLQIVESTTHDGPDRFLTGTQIEGETLVETKKMSGCVLCKMRNAEGERSVFKFVEAQDASRLDYEMEILSHLTDLPVPKVLQKGVWHGRPFLQLSWSGGVPLSEKKLEPAGGMRGAGGMTTFDRIDLAYRIIHLYTEIHQKGVVHGEAHLKNLLIDVDGSIRMLDLSHASRPGKKIGAARIAADYSYYPEDCVLKMLKGNKFYLPDFLDEQFAVAALVFHVLTGTKFSYGMFGGNNASVGGTGSSGSKGFLSPANVYKMLARALSTKRKDRYGSMQEFSASLKNGGPMPLSTLGMTSR